MLASWVKTVSAQIVRQVIRDGDRSDVLKIEKIIEQHCPFKPNTAYMEVPCKELDQAQADLAVVKAGHSVLAGKVIELLPAIAGHSHTIGADGQPSCGCKYSARSVESPSIPVASVKAPVAEVLKNAPPTSSVVPTTKGAK
jgi:hypothetical protein